MYAIAGITGNVGGAAASALLGRGERIRAIVRDPAKGGAWASRGADVAVADLADAGALASAFEGITAAFVLNPPAYRDPDLIARADELASAIRTAAREAGLHRLVVLSSIGAHIPTGTGNVATNRIFEEKLAAAAPSVVFVRPAYFMQNWAWVAEAASNAGILPSFLAPAGRAIPMVSTADVGQAVADELLGSSRGRSAVELEGPEPVSPDDVVSAFAQALGRSVTAVVVPESDWRAQLAASQFSPRTIEAWVELFRAFNSGWIRFERPADTRRGRTSIEEAVAAIVAPR
jgi:uncharacterized protein YbjT (DUF2867 family)